MSARMTFEERAAIMRQNQRTIRRSDIPAHLTVGASTGTRRKPKPRGWHSPGRAEMRTSPYWHSMVTIDSRWDK